MKKAVRIVIYTLLVVGIVANAYFMLSNGEPDKLWWWPLALGFFVWTTAPFAIIAVIDRFLAKDVPSKIVLLITTLVVIIGGVYQLIVAFIMHLDPQSGIIFIFLPFYQCLAVAIGVFLLMITKKVGNKKPPTKA